MCLAIVCAFGLAFHVAPPAPPLQIYAVDAGHSIVEFSIGFAFSRIKGRFTHSRGTILYDPTNPANSSVTVILDTKSLDTGWPHRDEHLRTADFFDVDRFPTITFQSQRLRKTRGGWIAEGPLTMHGVTKTIAIPFQFRNGSPQRDQQSLWMLIDVVGTARIARADFGILGGDKFNSWFTRARSATMADTVDIDIELEGWVADAASQKPPALTTALATLKQRGIAAQIARLKGIRDTTPPERWAPRFHGQDLLVRSLIEEDRVSDAVQLAAGLTTLFPDNASARLLYGFALSVSGDSAGAEEQYRQAKVIYRPPLVDPNEKFKQVDENWYYLDQLALTFVDLGRGKSAVGLARAIAEVYPGTAAAFTTYGYALDSSGDRKAALGQFDKALKLDPQDTRAIELARRPGAQGSASSTIKY